MKAGYSTNSLGDVDPLDALSLLCEQGYASLAITPDRNILNPYEKTFASEVRVWLAQKVHLQDCYLIIYLNFLSCHQ